MRRFCKAGPPQEGEAGEGDEEKAELADDEAEGEGEDIRGVSSDWYVGTKKFCMDCVVHVPCLCMLVEVEARLQEIRKKEDEEAGLGRCDD